MNKTVRVQALFLCAMLVQAPQPAQAASTISNDDVARQISMATEFVTGWLRQAGVQGDVMFSRDSKERNPDPANACIITVDQHRYAAQDADFVHACEAALNKLKAARPDLAQRTATHRAN